MENMINHEPEKAPIVPPSIQGREHREGEYAEEYLSRLANVEKEIQSRQNQINDLAIKITQNPGSLLATYQKIMAETKDEISFLEEKRKNILAENAAKITKH